MFIKSNVYTTILTKDLLFLDKPNLIKNYNNCKKKSILTFIINK